MIERRQTNDDGSAQVTASATSVSDGISSRGDGELTPVTTPSANAKSDDTASKRASDAASTVRERSREVALGAADRRAISRGIHAEVDLGEAGRIVVHAKHADGRELDVRLDTNVEQTARALSEHARELAVDLRSESREARVTVTGPGTDATTSSSNSENSGHSGTPGGGASGESASSRRENDGRDPRDPYAKESTPPAGHGAQTSRNSRRARFVL